MVFRKPPFKFGYRSVKNRTSRWLQYVNEGPKTENDQIYPQIPFLVRAIKYKLKYHPENTPAGQLKHMSRAMTDLFRDERVLLGYNKASELRPFAERLIVEAMRNGDCHRPTMAMANFWLLEKNLIHKLFKVFVPRYSEYNTAFTALHTLGSDYGVFYHSIGEKGWQSFQRGGQAVLELRGNSLPPILRPRLKRSGSLTNLLMEGARRHQETQETQQTQPQPQYTSSQTS